MKKFGNEIQPRLKKASYIILGACIYTIYNLDRRMKKPNFAAAKNSSLFLLKGIVHQFWIYNIFFVLTLSTITLNYFESELFYRDGPFIKNVSSVGTRKNVMYSKLVNNPFKVDWGYIIHKLTCRIVILFLVDCSMTKSISVYEINRWTKVISLKLVVYSDRIFGWNLQITVDISNKGGETTSNIFWASKYNLALINFQGHEKYNLFWGNIVFFSEQSIYLWFVENLKIILI